MEIIAQTSRRLELGYDNRSLSWFIFGATLFGSAFLGFGIWGIFAGQQKVLKCTRIDPVSVECQLKSSGIIRSQITRLSKIEKAEIVVGKSVENHVGGVSHDRDVYGIVLIANDRRISVSGVSTSNYKQKKADVDRINVFLSNPQEYFFKLESDGRWLGLAVGSILLLVGGAVIYALWQIKFVYRAVFDRNSGMLNIVKSSLYGKTEKLDYRLASINKLWIEESNSKDNTYYSVNLSCRQSQLTLLRTDNYSEAERLIANLRQFLDRT